MQTISTRLLIDNVAALRAGTAPRTDDKLIAALAAILDDAKLEPAFVALALVPPGEGDIAREIGRDIDPDAIYRARNALRAEIGEQARRGAGRDLRPHGRPRPLLARCRERRPPFAAQCRARSAGRDRKAPEAIARAAKQYDAADNMTDRMAALATLSLHDGPERERALGDFYTRYAADALVIDKWFSLQAMIPQPDTLDKVQRLTAHPAFSMANPNRVRALIGAFASQPDPVQPRRRRRLRLHRRQRAGARSEKSAIGGASGYRVPHLAHAGSRPPRQGAKPR